LKDMALTAVIDQCTAICTRNILIHYLKYTLHAATRFMEGVCRTARKVRA
jgi:hypothetical protein